MAITHKSFKSPGFRLAMLIFILFFLSWLIFFGLLPGEAELAGIPLITWAMVLLGAGSICIGFAAIFPLERWEKGWFQTYE